MIRTVCLAVAGIVLFSLASAALADAESDYKLLFGQDEAKVLARRNPKEIAAFAAKLLSAAKTVSEQKPLQNLLCEKAYDLAMRDASGYDTAIEAAKLQMEADPARKADARERLAKVLQLRFARSRGDERKTHGEELVGLLISGADELAAAGKATEAADAYRQALSVATAARSDRTKEIMDKVRAINDALQAEKKLAALKASLAADPKNVTTRTTLILIYLGERDDPAEAAKLLTQDVDEKLRTYVPLACKPFDELSEAACLELAQWYADMASKQLGKPTIEVARVCCLARAAFYISQFYKVHSASDTERLKAQLLEEQVKRERRSLPAAWIDLFKVIDPARDGTQGKWVLSAGKLASKGSGWLTLELPYHPPEEYDFEVEFTIRGGTMAQILVAGGTQFGWLIDTFHSTGHGFEMINGQYRGSNPTRVQFRVPAKPVRCRVEVRRDGVSAYFENKLVAQHKTDYRDMSWSLPMKDRTRLAIGAWQSDAVFDSARVLEVSGPARTQVRDRVRDDEK